MKANSSPIRLFPRLFAAAAGIALVSAFFLTPCASAQESQPVTVKVGGFPYTDLLKKDENGNYSGYGYDYLREIARYNGWNYEFVEAPWDECLSMLEKGELDLLGAVMRSDEREKRFDFSQTPMISGYGVLATPLDNYQLPYGDFQAFDGLDVGVLEGNQHAVTFTDFSRTHDFQPVLHTYKNQELLETALASGEIKAAVMTDLLYSDTLRVVAIFGENDAYFATTKGNTDILTQLNEAMRQIRLRSPYFNSRLEQKYFASQRVTPISFTRAELDFIENSAPVPCTYIPKAPPFNTDDNSAKSVQGISVDVLNLLEQRTGLTFEWQKPASADEAVNMLRQGRALLLPAKYEDLSWAEQNEVQLTDSYLDGQMVMVTGNRSSSPEVVALYDENSQGRLVASTLSDDATIKIYDTIEDCMNAVLSGDADATFVNAATASYMLNAPIYANLQTTSLYGFPADIAMAVSSSADPLLLSVLNKGLGSISSTEMNQMLLLQMKSGQTGAIEAFFHQHPVEVILMVILLFVILVAALLILIYKMKKTLNTDPLTGYSNFRSLCRDSVKLINVHPAHFAIVYMDIRRFKVINDTFGYDAGDRVLVATANALQDFIGQGEKMARVHADTFVLLLRYSSHEELQLRLANLSKRLEAPFKHDADGINPLFRGGVYPLSEDYGSLEKACDRANYAKGSIHQLFANTFAFYDDVIHHRLLAEKELEDSMNTALVRHEFVPYYQPKINAITECVVGAEALVRWHHPEKGCIPPSEFIPFYEENGFITKIDLSVFEQVCQDLHNWIHEGRPVVTVSVNFSRRNIQNKELPHRLQEIAAQYEVPTSLLEIEVTETQELENTEVAVNFVNSLKKYGFMVSVDDYGTGYSSITFLQQLPLDVLKLDRQFILNAMKSGQARDIMLHLVSAMHKNKIRILCEGIENEEQRAFVIGLNCRFIQGYFYSRPLPKVKFEEYLSQHGVDASDELDLISVVNFNQTDMTDMGDFLNRTMPSWIFSCYMMPGYPINYISSTLLAALDYSELEFMSETKGLYINAIYPDDLPAIFAAFDQRKSAIESVTLQYRLKKKDGSYLWIREVNKPVLMEDGRKALLGICTDITDMVTLQSEKERLIEAMPGGVGELLLTEQGPVIQQGNDRFYEIIGHTREEMAALDNNLLHIIHKESLAEAAESLKQTLQEKKTACECTFKLLHINGVPHWVTFFGTIAPEERLATIVIHNSDDEVKNRLAAEIERAKLAFALSLTGQAVFEYDLHTNTVYSHSGFASYGVPDGAALLSGNDLISSSVIHPDDAGKIPVIGTELLSEGKQLTFDIRVRSRGAEFSYDWIRVTMSAVLDKKKRPLRVIGVVENINQQKRFEYAFQQEAQYRRAFTESSLMAYEFNLTKDTIQRITGCRGFRLKDIDQDLNHAGRYSEMLAMSVGQLVAEADQEWFLKEMSRENLLALYQEGIYERELEYQRAALDGQLLWTSILIYLLLDQLSGDVIGYAYHRDIHEKKLAENDLTVQATRDSLTGLLNRATAEDMIRKYLVQTEEQEQVHALLMLDLNHFKTVNDTCGHLKGDKYLLKFAELLKKYTREQDIVARMGGDEFAILMMNIPSLDSALSLAERIADHAAGIGDALELDMHTSTSIGIALAPHHGNDFETLYHHADEAMYQAKQVDGVSIVVFKDA